VLGVRTASSSINVSRGDRCFPPAERDRTSMYLAANRPQSSPNNERHKAANGEIKIKCFAALVCCWWLVA
jgi:hypothetical protein